MLGLGLTFCGGFLYFGAWLARIAADNRDTAKRLADTLLVLADVVSHSASVRGGVASGPEPAGRQGRATRAGCWWSRAAATTVHRRDCALVATATT